MARKYIDNKLIRRIRMLMAIGVVLFGVVVYDIAVGDITIWLAVTGMTIGLIAGLAVGRMVAIYWHEDDAQIVSRIDRTGLVVTVIYIVFSITNRSVAGSWIDGSTLLPFSLATVAGVMTGRIVFMSIRIRSILTGHPFT